MIASAKVSRDERAGEIASMGRAGLLSGLGSAISGISNLVIVAVVARWHGDSGAGVFAIITAIANIGYQTGKFGMDTALVRLIPVYLVRGDQSFVRGLLRYTGVVVLGAGGLIGAVCVAAAPVVDRIFVHGGQGAVAAIVVIGVTLPVGCLTQLLAGASRGLGDIRWLVLSKSVAEPVMRVAAVIAAIGFGASAATAAIGSVLPIFITTVLLAAAVLRLMPKTGRRERLRPAHYRELWGFAGPRAASGVVEILGLHVSVLLVGWLAGAAEAGVFAVATRLLIAGALILNAVAVAVAPQIARLHAQGNSQVVSHLYSVSTGWIIASSWGILIVIAVLAEPVMALIGGDSFRSGGTALCVLALAMVVNLGTGAAQTILLMSGGSSSTLIISAVSLLAQILLCFALVPTDGIDGAALAKGLAVCGENAAVFVVVARLLKVRVEVRALMEPVLIAFLSALVGLSVYEIAETERALLLGMLATLAVGAALSLLRRRALQLDRIWRPADRTSTS